MSDSYDQAHDRLVEWAKALVFAAEASHQQISYALSGEIPVPEGCPSKVSFALTCFRGVRERFFEVQGAIKGVEAAIEREGS